MTYYYLPVNPEPWSVGPLGIGRSGGKTHPFMGKNAALASYQAEVKSHLEGVDVFEAEFYMLQFYFWRRLDDYETAQGKRHRKHVVDATNMQKALEDALQGVLIGNDRDVKSIRSIVVEQGADVKPQVVVCVSEWKVFAPCADFPDDILQKVEAPEVTSLTDNTWGGPGA